MVGGNDIIDQEGGRKDTTDTIRHRNGANTNSESLNRKSEEHGGNTVQKATSTVVPPDGGWGWVVVVASFGISLLVDGVCFSFGIFFDDLRNEFGTSKATTSWIGSVLNGSYLTLGPIVSALVNMYGCRTIAICGAVLSFVSFFISTFSPNIGVLIFTYGFLGGLGFGLMYLPAIVMVGYYFERRRALATGLACCGSGIGTFLFAPFTEHLLHQYGWRGANWILSALILHSLALAIFYRPLKSTSTVNPGNETRKLLDETAAMMLSPGGDDEIIDMTDVSVTPNTHKQTSQVISADLKAEIFEQLKSDRNLTPIYRGRTMSMHSPQTSLEGPNSPADVSDTVRLAFSQDFTLHHRKRNSDRQVEPARNTSMTPLQRKDIFYSGSLLQLKEFKDANSTEEYRRRVSTANDRQEQPSTPTRASFIQSFISVFDMSLLKSPTFLIYGFSCFMCMAGFFVPFVYLPTHALDLGMGTTGAAFLISIIGIANTVGRVAVGFISDQPWADCLLINNVALICGGVATLFVRFYIQYYQLAIYAAVFGTAIAIFVSLRSIIMVELMGLDKLTTSFGFVIMCQGLSSLLGPPLAGAISDWTGNYDAAFFMAGITLTLSGAMCLPMRRVAAWEENKKKNTVTIDNKNVAATKDTSRGFEPQDTRTAEEVEYMIKS